MAGRGWILAAVHAHQISGIPLRHTPHRVVHRTRDHGIQAEADQRVELRVWTAARGRNGARPATAWRTGPGRGIALIQDRVAAARGLVPRWRRDAAVAVGVHHPAAPPHRFLTAPDLVKHSRANPAEDG